MTRERFARNPEPTVIPPSDTSNYGPDYVDLQSEVEQVKWWVVSVTGKEPSPDVRLVDAVKDAAAKYRPVPPRRGDVITNGRIDDCPVGTVLRGKSAAMAAIRSVNGWNVTGMNADQARSMIKINAWVVEYVPPQVTQSPVY